MGSAGHPHVALIAFPFGTHAAPLLSLATALAAAAPGSTFSFINTARSNAGLARAIAAVPTGANIKIYDVPDGCPEGYVLPADDPEEEVRLFMRVTPGNFREAMSKAVEGAGARFTCVVSDAFLWFVGKMAEEMEVPWVPLWTGGSCSLVAHIYTDLLRHKMGDQATPARANEHLDLIPCMSAIEVRELPEGIVFGDLNSVFAVLLHRMAEELPRAAAVASNTFHGLDKPFDAEFDTKFKRFLPIGPLNLLAPPPLEPDCHNCLPWLDRQGPATVVYISFGTLMSLPPPEVAELAEGLEASGAPFLWSLKGAARAHLPPGFLDRTSGQGLVVPWTPQLRVLEHSAVGAFLTHCGWNSVLESMTSGVPMLCRPFLGDQRLNAATVSRVWKIGVGFNGGVVTRDAMETALRVVLKDEEGRGMREKARELRQMAIQATRPDGSSAKNFNSLLEIICGY